MFENIVKFFKSLGKSEKESKSKDAAKERLHLVLMQDRANISADFLALMKQEIIEVIKKYIDVDENSIDVRLTNKSNDDGTTGAPVLYANIPIVSVKEEAKEEARKEKNKKEQKIKEEIVKEDESKEKVKKEDKKTESKERVKNKKEEKEEDNSSSKTDKVIEEAEEIVEEIKDKEEAKNSNKKETKKKQ